MEKLETLLAKYNCQKCSEKPMLLVDQIEQAMQRRLPQDYKTFLLNYAGLEDCIGEEFIHLWDANELLECNSVYSIRDSFDYTLGIGTNGSGEFIGLEWTEEGTSRIVLSSLIDLDKATHIEIGVSFTDFLVRMDQGMGWFETDTEGNLEL